MGTLRKNTYLRNSMLPTDEQPCQEECYKNIKTLGEFHFILVRYLPFGTTVAGSEETKYDWIKTYGLR